MLVHKEVRKISKGIAGAAYEQLAKDDVFFKAYPNEDEFIRKYWVAFIPQARQALLQMLGGEYPEAMKEEIFDIYQKDWSLQEANKLKVLGTA